MKPRLVSNLPFGPLFSHIENKGLGSSFDILLNKIYVIISSSLSKQSDCCYKERHREHEAQQASPPNPHLPLPMAVWSADKLHSPVVSQDSMGKMLIWMAEEGRLCLGYS
jgi:hypothetical protein